MDTSSKLFGPKPMETLNPKILDFLVVYHYFFSKLLPPSFSGPFKSKKPFPTAPPHSQLPKNPTKRKNITLVLMDNCSSLASWWFPPYLKHFSNWIISPIWGFKKTFETTTTTTQLKTSICEAPSTWKRFSQTHHHEKSMVSFVVNTIKILDVPLPS